MTRTGVAWALTGLGLVAVLVLPPAATGDSLGLKRFVTPELNSAWRVGQRFTMNAPGLSAIEIAPLTVDTVKGRYRWRLREVPSGPERVGEVAASALDDRSSYTFTFEPVTDSMGHQFEFEITPVEGDPGSGIALRATKGDRLEDGGLVINGALRWASLAFQTHTTAVTPLRALISGSDADRLPRWLVLPGLLGGWIAIAFVLRGAWTSAARSPD